MKRILAAIFVLILASISCQTLMPTEPPSATEMPLVIEATLVVETEPQVTSTPRPTPHPITCVDDSCLNACLVRIQDAISIGQIESLGGDYAGTEADLNLVTYKVKDGELGEPLILYAPQEFKSFQEDLETQQMVWDYASALLPPDELKWIGEYYIFTDNADNVLAWVSPRGEADRSSWQLAVDIIDAQEPVYLTYTLVHEFGHLLTLNTDQIPPSDFYFGWGQNPSFCKQYLDPNGCSTPDSYINHFYQAFWVNIFEEWRDTVEKVRADTDDEYFALVDEFYSRHENEFVRDYAASNIHEDMAESFTYFVLEPKPEGDSVIDQKIRFFYDFPEMVALRQQIIQNVCSYTAE